MRGGASGGRCFATSLQAALLLVAAPLSVGQAPLPLVPGGPAEAVLLAAGECPTFRWTPAADVAHELALFADPASPALGVEQPVLRVTLAAGVDRWTPPSGWCPASGEAYAWAVRALDSDAAPWSEPSLFRVDAAPAQPIAELVAALREQLGDGADAKLRTLIEWSSPPPAVGGSRPEAVGLEPRLIDRVPFSADLDAPRRETSAASAGGPVALGSDHVGTAGFQDLELRAGGGRALLLQPTSFLVSPGVPNIVGGAGENVIVELLVQGATISGGGDDDTASGSHHRVADDFATIGGGLGNVAGQSTFSTFDQGWATVGGGVGNSALHVRSTVGGGSSNIASFSVATVAGGSHNHASGYQSAIGGGSDKTMVRPSGRCSCSVASPPARRRPS